MKAKQLFCIHDWEYYFGISSLNIRMYSYKRCYNCGKIKVKIKVKGDGISWYSIDNLPKFKRNWIKNEIIELSKKR